MTKLLSVRVVVAVDDAVDMKMLKPRLLALIAEAGTEDTGAAGDEPARIHWGTVDVLRGVEPRGEVAVRRQSGKRRSAANSGQTELVQ